MPAKQDTTGQLQTHHSNELKIENNNNTHYQLLQRRTVKVLKAVLAQPDKFLKPGDGGEFVEAQLMRSTLRHQNFDDRS